VTELSSLLRSVNMKGHEHAGYRYFHEQTSPKMVRAVLGRKTISRGQAIPVANEKSACVQVVR
jgi:hypothetical protein